MSRKPMASRQPATYKDSGVDYDAMDAFKRLAQRAASQTAGNIARLGLKDVPASRGESAYLIEAADHYLAHVEEGLGTKNLVADGLPDQPELYANIAQDTVAMIVNDMITLGALPVSVAMHLAAGSSEWFEDQARLKALVEGWQRACNLARCVWGGGETPTLKGVVEPGAVVLSGSAIGVIAPKGRRIKGDIQSGDAIVLLASSGVHANGLTLARQIAAKAGPDAKLSDGRRFSEALLDPTHIYVPVVEGVLAAGVDIHYAVNITGHGWRKLMRATEPFVYTIESVSPPQPVFAFIQKHGPIDDAEMYGNYNMGAGFALYVAAADVETVVKAAAASDIKAWPAGHIEKRGTTKQVVIKPKNLTYDGSTLAVR
ncbi:MAG TPA: AIR synthase-related protein [Candidatus Saccharimonadales bacterium]|nr:AIR synthase-related protein [Candidatus Saccharimonadales bacterium]